MKGIWRSTALLTVLAAVVGISGCKKGEATQTGSAGSGATGRRGQPRIAVVQTVAVTKGSIARSVIVSGVVEPLRTVAVNSQLSGAVLAVKVEEGSLVRAGDTLARARRA